MPEVVTVKVPVAIAVTGVVDNNAAGGIDEPAPGIFDNYSIGNQTMFYRGTKHRVQVEGRVDGTLTGLREGRAAIVGNLHISHVAIIPLSVISTGSRSISPTVITPIPVSTSFPPL